MGICMITFRSVTPAQRAEKLLRSAGIHCNLGRTPRWMEQLGCGYSVRAQYRDLEALTDILRSNKIVFRKIYLRKEKGVMEELEL